jgi:hypothetical protein
MPNFFGRFCPWFALLAFVALVPSTAAAQESAGKLRIPTIAASAAATADWVSTYQALKYYKVREQNPMLRPFQDSPGSMVSLGGLIDVGSVSAWNLTVGRKNQRVAVAGLWAMTAFRTYLAIHNMRNMRISERR